MCKKTRKTQVAILNKDIYVTPDETFETLAGIDDDLAMIDDEYHLLNVRS